MHCLEFLALYSDYRDGLIFDLGILRRVRGHLAECAKCRRYDAVIRRGVATLRKAELDVMPARRRIAESGHEEVVERTPARFMGAVMLLAALALLVWEGLSVPQRGDATAGPGLADLNPVVVANPGVPFVRFDAGPSRTSAVEPPSPQAPSDINPALTLYQPTPDR